MMDLDATILAAKRADAAYTMGASASRAAFTYLGDLWLGMFQNGSHQAVASVDGDGQPWLSISGTRAGSFEIMDLFDDIDLTPVPVPGGGNVSKGVYEGMADVWRWALMFNPNAKWNVCGHSLGAARTHLTPIFISPQGMGNLYSFESPKFCDADYYAAQETRLQDMVCVLNGSDLWASWPWLGSQYSRPLPLHLWLFSIAGGFKMIPGDAWPGGVNPADHDMNLVLTRLQSLPRQP